MLDRWSVAWVRRPVAWLAKPLEKRGITADQVTIGGFCVGILAMFALGMGWFKVALSLIVLNRLADGIDGVLARKNGTTDAGGFLDIVLDFIFYASVAVGFAFAEPDKNALPAMILLFSFMGTGSSFLAFASIAGKRGIESPVYKKKSLYYLGGLTEGTETIVFFVIICLFPSKFPLLALLFAAACFITTTTRIVTGYHTLSKDP